MPIICPKCKSPYWKNPKYGYKEVYCLNKNDYKWFKLNENSYEIKKYIKEVLLK